MQNQGGPRFGTSRKTCVSKSDKDVKRKVTWQRQLSTGESFSAWGQPFFPSTVLGQQADHVQASLDEVVWRGLKVELCSHISFWVKMNFGHFPGNDISTKAIQQSRYHTSKKESKHRLIYDERFLAHIFGKGVGAKLTSQNFHLLCIPEVS